MVGEKNMKFTDSHEWIIVEKGEGIVGITDFAQKELGEISYIALPKIGTQVEAGEEICILESTKAAADIYSPVSGTVVAVNSSLAANPALLNESPQEKGWL